jgi:hypothetical protein
MVKSWHIWNIKTKHEEINENSAKYHTHGVDHGFIQKSSGQVDGQDNKHMHRY